MSHRRRNCNSCVHLMCDVVGRNRPERNIDFICESISLFERVYGSSYKEETREMSLEAISKYGPGTPFENDERMLPVYRILGKYSRSMSATDIYDRLFEKNLFVTSSRFYQDWADVYIGQKGYDKALHIVGLMEKALGKEHDHVVNLRSRVMMLLNEKNNISRTSAAAPSARRSLFTDAPSEFEKRPTAPTIHPPQPSAKFQAPIGLPIGSKLKIDENITPKEEDVPRKVNKEPIVLPNIGAAPPVALDIVSPSVLLIQSGQIPANFSLPPVFSFSNSTHSYTSMAIRETSVNNTSSMSSTLAPSLPSFSDPFAHLPSHPAQTKLHTTDPVISTSQSSIPVPPGLEMNPNGPLYPLSELEDVENKDPVPLLSVPIEKRVITGVLLPSQGILTEDYDLEKSQMSNASNISNISNMTTTKSERALSAFELKTKSERALSAFELKKTRQTQGVHHSTAARRIFSDPTLELESAFSSMGINSPSTSKQ